MRGSQGLIPGHTAKGQRRSSHPGVNSKTSSFPFMPSCLMPSQCPKMAELPRNIRVWPKSQLLHLVRPLHGQYFLRMTRETPFASQVFLYISLQIDLIHTQVTANIADFCHFCLRFKAFCLTNTQACIYVYVSKISLLEESPGGKEREINFCHCTIHF